LMCNDVTRSAAALSFAHKFIHEKVFSPCLISVNPRAE
jgi:hypothetical protein